MSDNPDPIQEMIESQLAAQQQRFSEHEAFRNGADYKAAIKQIDTYIRGYAEGLNAIDLMATRHPPFFEKLISLLIKPHFLQSAVATSAMIKEGLFDPAKREMRFIVEASVKAMFLDRRPITNSQITTNGVDAPKTALEKVAAFDVLGRQRFDELINSLKFGLLDEAAAKAYRQSALSLYSQLSTTVHITSNNIQRDLSNFENGKHFAFETVADVNKIARLLRQVLDLALASHLEAFDHGLVGDMFEPPFNSEWSFLKMPLVAAVDRHFDYKHERRVRRGEVD